MMKQILKTLALSAVFALGTTPVAAQEFGGEPPQRQSVEELAKEQGASIAKSLKLKKAATKKFVADYTAFQKELQQLRPQMGPRERQGRGPRPDGQRPSRQQGLPKDSLANRADGPRRQANRRGEPTEEMKQRMAETQKKIQALREKYAAVYADYLTPEQIAQIEGIEKKLQQQRRQQMRQRFEQMRQQRSQMGGGSRGGWGDDDF